MEMDEMVESTTYRPWRAMGEQDDLLAEDVSRGWREFVAESRANVVELRRITADADRRLSGEGVPMAKTRRRDAAGRTHELHRRILEQLDTFEMRLRKIELKMGTPEVIAHPMTQPRSDAA